MINVSTQRMQEAQSRAQELISKLSLTEKVGQLSQFGTSIYNDETRYYEDHYPDGKIGSYLTVSGAKVTNKLQKECKERFPNHIPLLFAEDVIHGYRTTLPTPLAQSCSWDPEAAKKGAQVAAKEAYAAGIKWTFSPMVDIARDARWGRVVEGYGEDTYLCSRFAEATVKGYQGNEIGDKYSLLACMKHFIAYGACVAGRDYNEVDMSLQTLYDVYLPSFQAGIDAGAATVMAGFNSFNGVPCSGSKFLLKDLLRDQCGFDGVVISDAGSVDQMTPHGYAKDWPESSLKGFQAGIDILMAGDLYNDNLPRFIEEGKITEEDVDNALLPFITLKILLGLFDNPYVDESEEEKLFFCEEHINASREIGRDCIVLLENNGVLPLEKGKKVSLVGPLADDKENVLGTWACKKDPSKTISVLEGLKKAGVDVSYARGCDISEGTDEEMNEAVEVVLQSDVAVVVLGESFKMTGEAKSRVDLTLPDVQLQLLDKVIATGIPVVVLLSSGRPIVVESFRERVAALVYTWQLGTAMGDAVADIITGKHDANGRLSISIPRCVGQVPIYYNCMNTGHPYYGKVWYETCYIDESIYPRYAFGYGLSYTTFEYSDLQLSSDKMTVDGCIEVSCKITNTGKREGKTVAQLYIHDLVASCVRPVRQLKGFEKVSLEAGESCVVNFTLQAKDLAFHNEKLEKVVEPGEFHLWIGQDSNDQRLFAEFEVVE